MLHWLWLDLRAWILTVLNHDEAVDVINFEEIVYHHCESIF